MTDIFIVLVEESNIETTDRDLQVFSSLQACHRFLYNKVEIYKQHKWAEDLRPPECPTMVDLQILPENEVHPVYEFEHQTPSNDFFCITLFVKKTKILINK